jgi:hypothetical protein
MSFLVNSPRFATTTSAGRLVDAVVFTSPNNSGQYSISTNVALAADDIILVLMGDFFNAGVGHLYTSLLTVGLGSGGGFKLTWARAFAGQTSVTIDANVTNHGLIVVYRPDVNTRAPFVKTFVSEDGSTIPTPTTLTATGYTKGASPLAEVFISLCLSSVGTVSTSIGTQRFSNTSYGVVVSDVDPASGYTNGTAVNFNTTSGFGTYSVGFGIEIR